MDILKTFPIYIFPDIDKRYTAKIVSLKGALMQI